MAAIKTDDRDAVDDIFIISPLNERLSMGAVAHFFF
jgi:hypothetical protein